MNDVFIHVGLQKTGTTALQELVFKKLDVNYIRYLDRSIYLDKMYEDVPVLISNEDLCGSYPLWNRYEILENLNILFPEAHIILGLRDRDTWMRSMYLEAVRQGCIMCYDDFNSRFAREALDFESYEKMLRRKFPAVFTFSFEELKKDFDGVVSSLCDFIGVPIPVYENRMMNESIAAWQVPGFRVMNTIAPNLFKFVYKFIRRDLRQ